METPPAGRLQGLVLDGGWKVLVPLVRSPDASGGANSHTYLVEGPDGQHGFLKAIDLASSARFEDPLQVLQGMLKAYLHERDICLLCRDLRMRRVTGARASGQAQVEPGISGSVPYIIFEHAQADVRHYLDEAPHFDAAWALRTLHQVASGLWQLHRADVAHLDLKPSNAVICEGAEGAKVADLGTAVRRGSPAPHEDHLIAGDTSYAPPELHYNFISPDWNQRRLGCDLYLLGSLAVFLFARVNMTALISSEMDGSQHWRQWTGGFEEVLPYLRHGFNRAIEKFEAEVWEPFRDSVVPIVRQLCDPDPRRRGHPVNHFEAANGSFNRYSLNRYVSRFDLLATRAEIGL